MEKTKSKDIKAETGKNNTAMFSALRHSKVMDCRATDPCTSSRLAKWT